MLLSPHQLETSNWTHSELNRCQVGTVWHFVSVCIVNLKPPCGSTIWDPSKLSPLLSVTLFARRSFFEAMKLSPVASPLSPPFFLSLSTRWCLLPPLQCCKTLIDEPLPLLSLSPVSFFLSYCMPFAIHSLMTWSPRW